MNLLLTQGNAVQIPLADESVHCVVTSPPYWGLRDYGIGGQLGLEPTPEQYIENMVAVFREVKRVLRADGTLWLNMGDSYTSGGRDTRNPGQSKLHPAQPKGMTRAATPAGLKPKDLCGIPWRLAFALQADGWWLRSDIIWSKPNPMPESVTDRPTKGHEYVFLLTKSARYYYDADGIREEGAGREQFAAGAQPKHTKNRDRNDGNRYDTRVIPGRNRRTVWHIATAPYSGAHFATYPPALVEPCIKAGTSERGVCPECGAPWERVVERIGGIPNEHFRFEKAGNTQTGGKLTSTLNGIPGMSTTIDWQPTCECRVLHKTISGEGEQFYGPYDPIPATVFDPFAGSGTTLQVARALGRSGIGLDLSAEYLQLARKRLELDALDAWTDGGKKDGKAVTDLPMFEELR